MTQRRFVLLDRDGTIIVEHHYLSDARQVELIPRAASALRQLSGMGLGLVVITNQSAIGRGFISQQRLDLIHRRFHELLEAEGVQLDGIYFCPHTPEDNCRCRKPRPGLVEAAAVEFNFDPRAAFMIGDSVCDIELARDLGATAFLVRTGCGAAVVEESATVPDYIVDDLVGAASVIKRLLEAEQKTNAVSS